MSSSVSNSSDSMLLAYSPVGVPIDIHDSMEKVRQMGELQPEKGSPLLEGLPPEMRQFIQNMLERINGMMDTISGFFKRILPEIDLGEGVDPTLVQTVIQYVTIGLLLILAGFVFFFILLQIKKRWAQHASHMPKPASFIGEQDGQLLVSSRSHMEKAQALAESEHYAEGTRELYLATLCLLDETQVVPFEANRTNLEYIRRIQTLPASKTASEGFQAFFEKRFGHIAFAFEGIRYGHKPTNETAYRECQEQTEQMLGRLKSDSEQDRQGE